MSDTKKILDKKSRQIDKMLEETRLLSGINDKHFLRFMAYLEKAKKEIGKIRWQT